MSKILYPLGYCQITVFFKHHFCSSNILVLQSFVIDKSDGVICYLEFCFTIRILYMHMDRLVLSGIKEEPHSEHPKYFRHKSCCFLQI